MSSIYRISFKFRVCECNGGNSIRRVNSKPTSEKGGVSEDDDGQLCVVKVKRVPPDKLSKCQKRIAAMKETRRLPTISMVSFSNLKPIA